MPPRGGQGTERRRGGAGSGTAALVAKEQGLPLGWLAERRSGGHYVVYSPSGERFTSINAARQAARAEAETAKQAQRQVPPAPPKDPTLEKALVEMTKREKQLSKTDELKKSKDETSEDEEKTEDAALPNVGDPFLEGDLLYEAAYQPPEQGKDWAGLLASVDAAMATSWWNPKHRGTTLESSSAWTAWRRGERLEACYEALYAGGFDPGTAAKIVKAKAKRRRLVDAPWSDTEAVDAAKYIDSLDKDVGAIASKLKRPLGEVVAWYYREYKAVASRSKARWPSKIAYDATKKKRRQALSEESTQPATRSKPPLSPQSPNSSSGFGGLRVDTRTPASPPGSKTPICTSPRLKRPQGPPRGWAPTPRNRRRDLKIDDDELDDVDDDNILDLDDIDLDDDDENVEVTTTGGDEPPIYHLSRIRHSGGSKRSSSNPHCPIERVAKARSPRGVVFDGGKYASDANIFIRPPRGDPLLNRLAGATYQGLAGSLWYVTRRGDTVASVAKERSLCARQLGFVNAKLVQPHKQDEDEDMEEDDDIQGGRKRKHGEIDGLLEEGEDPKDLGPGLALLLPQNLADTTMPLPSNPKLAGGEVVAAVIPRETNTMAPQRHRVWYLARGGETLSAIALFLVGAPVSQSTENGFYSGGKKKVVPSPRLGSRAHVDDAKNRQALVDALFREQLKWLRYDDAKAVFGTSLDDKTPVLLPDHAPWPRPPNGQGDRVIGVAPPVLEGDDADALLRGDIVVEKETKRRWAAIIAAGRAPRGLTGTKKRTAELECRETDQSLVALPATGVLVASHPPQDKQPRWRAQGLPRSLKTAARSMGVEEAELRRLNAALDLDRSRTDFFSDGVLSRGQQGCKIAMLLLPEPLRSACASCRVSRISSWVCRSELKHTAAPCDRPPPGGWLPGSRVKVLAKTKRKVVEYIGGAFRERDDVGRVWLDAKVERATETPNEKRATSPVGGQKSSPSPSKKLLVVEAQGIDPRDGELYSSTSGVFKRKFAVHWPSPFVASCPPAAQQQKNGLVGKAAKFLVGRTLEAWGDGPPIAAVALPDHARWRVTAVYRTVDETLRVSGDDDLVALLEPAERAVDRVLAESYQNKTSDDKFDPYRGYARCAVKVLQSTGAGWRPCAACVVDGCRDALRCRRILRHDDPDCDTLPRKNDAVRLRIVRDDGVIEWLYGVAVGCRRNKDGSFDENCPSFERDVLGKQAPDVSKSKALEVAVSIKGASLDRLKSTVTTFKQWLHSNKLQGDTLVVTVAWVNPRDAVSVGAATPEATKTTPPQAVPAPAVAPAVGTATTTADTSATTTTQTQKESTTTSPTTPTPPAVSNSTNNNSKSPPGYSSSSGAKQQQQDAMKTRSVALVREPSAEQRTWIGRFWRKKSDDFSKLRAAISRNEAAKGEGRLRIVVDVFESFAEGLDGVCVRHAPAAQRSSSLAALRQSSQVTRCDAFVETMVPADALGSSLQWHPSEVSETYLATKAPELMKNNEPGDVVQLDDNGHYLVCRGGETLPFLAEWTGTDATQLRRANRRLLEQKVKGKTSKDDDDDDEEESPSRTTSPGSSKRRRDRPTTTASARKRQRVPPPKKPALAEKNEVVFQKGDVVQIPSGPVKRRVPPVDAVRGDSALASSETVVAGTDGSVWYACKEDETCDVIAKHLGRCDAHEIVAANRHRRGLRSLTSRSPLAKWTVLLVPQTTSATTPAPVKRRKPCAACIILGEKSTRACRDDSGHTTPDYDDLSAATPLGKTNHLGAKVRVRWVDEDSNSAQWLYARVTGHTEKHLVVTYDEVDGGIDEIEWPNLEAVAVPLNSPPRPKVLPAHEALIGKSFEWKQQGRWIVTDVFDSLDEGVDALVAFCKPLQSSSKRKRDDDDDEDDVEEIYETLDDLLNEAMNWQDPVVVPHRQQQAVVENHTDPIAVDTTQPLVPSSAALAKQPTAAP